MHVPTTVVSGGTWDGKRPVQANIDLIELLEEKNYFDGAKIIFGIDALAFQEISEEEPGEDETCPNPNPTEEIKALSNPRDRVMKAVEELNGQKACSDFCGESVEFVYIKAAVTQKCYYSDKAGQKYIVGGKTITIGEDENDKGEIIFQIPTTGTTCSIQIGALETYGEKLGHINPGDWLDIAWPKQDDSISSHAVIFIEWVDREKGYARVFDWIGGGFRTYGYQNIYLTENNHPVYFYKNPILSA